MFILFITFQVLRREVDFFINGQCSAGELFAKEDAMLYPPRFRVFFACHHSNVEMNDGRIEFRGANKRLSYDIYLKTPEAVSIPGKPVS